MAMNKTSSRLPAFVGLFAMLFLAAGIFFAGYSGDPQAVSAEPRQTPPANTNANANWNTNVNGNWNANANTDWNSNGNTNMNANGNTNGNMNRPRTTPSP